VGLIQSPGIVRTGSPFGGPEDVKFTQDLWAALVDARLVGGQAVNVMPYEGSIHKTVLMTLDSTVRVGNHTGVVIVKRMYQGPDISVETVINDPTQNLKVVAVMFKRAKGYDPSRQDWFYGKLNPGGTAQKNKKGKLMVGRAGKCIGCHETASGGDYIFSFTR
jgi:hypothetical protein